MTKALRLLRPSHSVSSSTVHPAQDIWAMGCLLHALLFGRLPFTDGYEPRLVEKILRGVWERSRSPKSRSNSRTRRTSRSTSRHPGKQSISFNMVVTTLGFGTFQRAVVIRNPREMRARSRKLLPEREVSPCSERR